MHRNTRILQPTRAVLDSMLGAAGGTPPGSAIFDDCKLRLFGGATIPTLDSVLADFTATAAVGYAEQVLSAFSGPLNPNGQYRAYAAAPTFVFGDNRPSGVEIAGYYLVNTAGTTLLAAERFTTPVNVLMPGDELQLDLYIAIPTQLASGLSE